MKTIVWVKTQLPIIHCWPNAPKIVEFLKHPHRHLFHFKVGVFVVEDDREVEFLQFKAEVENCIFQCFLPQQGDRHCVVYNDSCEMMAKKVKSIIEIKGFKVAFIEVSEDNENGAIITEMLCA